MNDDFLKKHQIRPTTDFVESLHETLEIRDQRTFNMFTNKMRPALLTLTILLGVGLLSFAFSPSVRAALQSIFTYNGVEITVDDGTGLLTATGNTEAIVSQTDHSIMIQGIDSNEIVGMSIPAIEETPISIDELATIAPDFVLPTNLPAGYELNPEAYIFGDTDVVSVNWTNAAGETISYNWGELSFPDELTQELAQFEGDDIVVVTGATDLSELPPEVAAKLAEHAQPYKIVPDLNGGELAILNDEQDGVAYQISATDTTLGETVLRAIAP